MNVVAGRLALIAATCLLLAGCGGSAARGHGVDIQAIFDESGNPVLGANFTPDGSLAKPRWSICPPHADCTRTSHRGSLDPGPAAPGTVFEAAAAYRGRTYVARTSAWRGTVHPTDPPKLIGPARAGATVTPLAGDWDGGWGGEFDLLHVEACRTRAARDCVTLSAQGEDYPGSRDHAVVSDRYAGWYLFALDQRFARDTAFAGVGRGSAAGVPPLETGPTVSRSAPVGPVSTP